MYRAGNSVEQVFGGTVIKQGDRTPFGFMFRNENGEVVSLTNTTVKIKIANERALLLEKDAILTDEYTATFSLGQDDITGSGDMRLEFTVTYADGLQEKFPSDDWQRIRITPTLEDINKTGIAYLTFEKMKADFTQKVNDLNIRVDNLVIEAGNSNPEIVEARGGANSLKERLDDAQAELQTQSAKLDGYGINAMQPPATLTALKGDYNYVTMQGTDDSDALQALINYASILGLRITLPPRKYLILKDIDMKPGVILEGFWQGPKQEGMTNRDFKGTTLILRGAQFSLSQSITVRGMTIFYDQQKYRLSYDTNKPDGIEDFIEYKPTFLAKGSGSFTIKELNYIGGSTILEQASGDASALFEISRIYGMATKVGLYLKNVLDISHVSDIRMNCTSNRGLAVGSYLPGQPNQAVYNKIAKNFTLLKLGRIDGVTFTRCFTFGARDFAWMYSNADGGAGVAFIECEADTVHNAFRIECGGNPFGIKIIGGSFAPIAHNPLYDGGTSLTTETPAFIRTSSTASGNRILIDSAVTFGTSNPVFDRDIGKCVTPYQLATTANTNIIMVVNSFHYDYTGVLATGYNNTNKISTDNVRVIGDKFISTIFGETWTDLTLVNGTQAYDVTPIARYKVDKNGFVTIQMRIKNMTIGSPVAYLPAELRPDHTINFIAPTAGAATSFAKGFIATDGAINFGSAVSITDAQTLTSVEETYKLP